MPISTLPFLDAWEKLLHNYKFPRTSSNLSPAQRDALSSLTYRGDIVVCKGEKGNNTVVLSRSRYVQIAEQMLNTDTYQKVSSIPDIQAEFSGILALLAGRIPSRVLQQLQLPGPKLPHFYGLPKLHKKLLALRPIVSQ